MIHHLYLSFLSSQQHNGWLLLIHDSVDLGFSTSLSILAYQPVLASIHLDHHTALASVLVAFASVVVLASIVDPCIVVALELIQIPFWLFGNLPPSCYIIS